uniref:Heat shock protein 12A n=1 Tax=Astyanax mexicanus TaxID=7994 RepID=A0A8B9JBX6_ASTMX
MADSIVFIAVDFGTSFSGYCFKIAVSEQIRQPQWGKEYGLETPKTPTCILFDENEKFLRFGYDLYVFFSQELHRDIMLTAKNGEKIRPMKVFSESLRFMKDHALKMIRKYTAGVKYSASDATWILTVPAIWSAAAKQFMREALHFYENVSLTYPLFILRIRSILRLIIALEPEAASVWCRQLPHEDCPCTVYSVCVCANCNPRTMTNHKEYMHCYSINIQLCESHVSRSRDYFITELIFLIGRTIDITVHEVVQGACLKELHRVSVSDMGGQTVDKNFKMFLRELFSEVFDEFEENHPSEVKI